MTDDGCIKTDNVCIVTDDDGISTSASQFFQISRLKVPCIYVFTGWCCLLLTYSWSFNLSFHVPLISMYDYMFVMLCQSKTWLELLCRAGCAYNHSSFVMVIHHIYMSPALLCKSNVQIGNAEQCMHVHSYFGIQLDQLFYTISSFCMCLL